MESESVHADAIADALADAYSLNRPNVSRGFAAPIDLSEAAQVQAGVAKRLNARVAGWKLGYTPDGTAVAAPIFDRFLKASGAHFPLRESGVWGVEIEIAVRLGADLPRRIVQRYSREEVVSAVDAVLAGIEVIGSRVVDHMEAPFLLYLADNIGNSGYVAGADQRNWSGLDLADLRAMLTINGAVVHDAKGGHPVGDPLKPIVDYVNAQNDRLGGLRAGQVVTTGSLCGLIPVEGPGEVAGAIDSIGEARLYIHG